MARNTSTRGKIKWEALQLQHDVERMHFRLRKIDDLAGGKSEVVNKALPGLVTMLETVKTVITGWYGEL